MKKSIKIGLGILSLGFISSATIGTVISCSNDQINNENNESNDNSSNNTLYNQSAKIVASLLPGILPKSILLHNVIVNSETAITMLSTPSSIQQLESLIKSNLIQVMNKYVSNPSNSPNPTILTVLGTNYTASELVANLNINFPSAAALEKVYSYNDTSINVTFSYDNYPINLSCEISGFDSPLETFDSYYLDLHNISLSNWNENIVESLNDKTVLSNAIERNIKQQLNNNLNKLVINNIKLTPEEVMSGLRITIPSTVSYSNGELQRFYITTSALNNPTWGVELNVTGFKPFTFTNTIWQDVSNKLQSIIDSAIDGSIYLGNYNYNAKETLSSQYNSEFSQAVINHLEYLNIATFLVSNNISFNTYDIIQKAQCLLPTNLTQAQINSDESSESISGVILKFNSISVTLPTIYLNMD